MPEKRRGAFYYIGTTLCIALILGLFCAWVVHRRDAAENVPQPGTSSSSSETPVTGRAKKPWTVLIYMCGTDLETVDGAATANLGEICRPMNRDSINVVIQTGGTRSWKLGGIPEDKLARFEVVEAGLACVGQYPLASMGDEATLASFLEWGVDAYPAEKYMLLLWNHGGGSLGGVCYDELFDSDSLELDEIAGALDASGVTYELIGFDACLMATLENAALLRDYGRYMVASEEFEPGGGWDYADFLGYLSTSPDVHGAELGRRICQGYYNKCSASQDETMATLSVIDLRRIDTLLNCFDLLAAEMGGLVEEMEQLQELTIRARRAENYGGNSSGEGYTNMVDLGDLVSHTRDVLPETCQAVLDALDAAVLHSVSGRQRDGAQGLSLFFPLDLSAQDCGEYTEVCPSPHYLRFLEAIVPGFSAPDDTPAPRLDAASEDDYDIRLVTTVTDDANYTLWVKDGLEAVQSVQFWLFYVDYEYGEYVTMGMDNDVHADWEEGIFADNFRGVWPTINGFFCAPVLVDEGEAYNIYSIPILLNGVQTNLRAAYIWDDGDNGHYEIYGAWEGVDSDTGAVSRTVRKLRDGDEVELIFASVDWETGEELYYTMGSFTVDGEIVMEESELIDGDYLYAYEVVDVFGRSHMSDFALMSSEGDEIRVSAE
ncbi:MAG: hypothetical protein E7463_12030 [Ruminococcaceae bacterium]|nr:hypothetical protein [Oscillospiraceae bacterium]